MKEWLRKNICRILLFSLQTLFLGGGYVYIEEFKAIRDQIKASERIVNENLGKLTETAEEASKALKKTNDGLKKVEKACKRLF